MLRRATFGGSKTQIDAVGNMNSSSAVDMLFDTVLPQPAPPIDLKTGTEWVYSGFQDGVNSNTFVLVDQFLQWFLGQMMSPGITDINTALAHAARERVVYFLHTHFTTIESKVNNVRSLYFQNQLYRLFATNNSVLPNGISLDFKSLTVKVSIDNAMIRLLDGDTNVKGGVNGVNENYARELFELYSIGRGLEGTPLPPGLEQGDYVVYKESDIRQAAYTLSGWETAMPLEGVFDPLATEQTTFGFDPDTLLPRGKVKGSAENASQHDNTVKTFSDRLGGMQVTPDATLMPSGNPTEESAIDEITQLIDIIYAQPETARNICRRIYRFFVWAAHTDAEAQAIETVIDDMVATFKANNYKLIPVIKQLLQSKHFYEAIDADPVDDANFGAIIKSPIDLTLGTLKFFDITIPAMETDPAEFYRRTSRIITVIGKDRQGMSFFEPFDVAGYEAYHQYPIYHRAWITPNTLGHRYDFVRGVINGIDNMEDDVFNLLDARQFVQTHFSTVAADAPLLIRTLAEYLLPFSKNLTFEDADDDVNSSLSSQRLNWFLAKMFDGILSEAEWADYWNNRPDEYADIRRALQNLLNAMLQTPEYQLS
ncbi:DUF1800 domain-containing protein [Parachryseolinea silvisoli]|uniref:DUF1800 domain-containing protein n=1 Tax=Parachryseolinea silvisoli TaxID=2873601 RepID=UPI0022658E38|nr:DUF1800 domain-containing protein [Parachryseolinea silvisoli]MCD9018384.1 DUF1800 domain-containing protein [Parachryseolinea silvisoli]